MAEGFELSTSGPTEFVCQQVTLHPGEKTGWHYHPGEVLVVVESGTLTRYEVTGIPQVHSAGDAFVEPGGEEHVHIGCNFDTTPVRLHLTYVNPVGSPLSVEAGDPHHH